MDDLMPIGRFARLAGLSVGALRHYDQIDLLHPADVDQISGYRRYRPAQIETARTIARLRDLELPLEEIRTLVATDATEQRRRLETHRARVEARIIRLQRLLHLLGQIRDGKAPIVTEPGSTTRDRGGADAYDFDPATHRHLGTELYNTTWSLLEREDRTAAETDEMIHRAHASRWHWARAGGDIQLARGEWLCSRVYAALGRGEPALWHARRCLDINESTDHAESWDLPSAYEAMARASFVAGDTVAGAAWKVRAVVAVDAIEDPDDREIIDQDLLSLP